MPRCFSAWLMPVAGAGRGPVLWAAPCIAVWLALSSFPSPALAIGPSFDCSKAQTSLAQFICASPVLSKADLEFVQSYYALRQQVGLNGWQILKVEAVNFQTYVAQQCGIPPSSSLPVNKVALQACLIQTYKRQGLAWRSRLQGPALEEASRPIEEHIALQARLQSLGFLPKTEEVDGVYGAATRTSIANWQQVSGLPATGFLANVDAAKLASSSVAVAESASQGEAPSSGASLPPSQPALIPMADLATIYARAPPPPAPPRTAPPPTPTKNPVPESHEVQNTLEQLRALQRQTDRKSVV